METSNCIVIKAAPAEIFDLASRVEDWGDILPHYRYVRLLHQDGKKKWVKMSAWRNFVPVTWTAICTVEPGMGTDPGKITFRHIRGLVRGMYVEWWFEPRPEQGDVVVGISHYLDNPPFPTRILGPRVLEAVVGRGFIGYIAGKTLQRMKEIAEGSVVDSSTRAAEPSRAK